ncbi:hypothetical protein BZA77DRAFT_350824 [Pyronema omphalodes]|nr:hypothetical protein BZA77DRAFT_350824 [Pyronema omphalodes]
MASQDPLSLRFQGQFSSYGSNESSTTQQKEEATSSPVASRRRQSSGVFHKRSLSPTTSTVSSVNTNATLATLQTIMAPRSSRSQRSLLGRGLKKNSVAEEFDPTTFRKNRSRPAAGARGQDAVYQEYDDLFEEEDEDDSYADGEASASQTDIDASGDEKGMFLLHAEMPGARGHLSSAASARSRSPDISPISPRSTADSTTGPRTKRSTLDNNLSYVDSNSHLSYIDSKRSTLDNNHLSYIDSNSAPPPPRTPPRSWPRSVPMTTTPPRSTAPSLEESIEPRLPLTAPPTPPPKNGPLSLDTNIRTLPQIRHESAPGERRTPPPFLTQSSRSYSERSSSSVIPSISRQRSSEGLDIHIPSPTLFTATTEKWDDSNPPPPPQKNNLSISTSPIPSLERPPSKHDSLDSDAPSVKVSIPPLRLRSDSQISRSNTTSARTSTDGGIDSARSGGDDFLQSGDAVSRRPSHASVYSQRSERTSISKASGKRRRSSAYNVDVQTSSSEADATPSPGLKPDPAYLRAFRSFVKASANNDAFVSREPRFDAIQAHRICSHLREDFPLQVTPSKRRPSNATLRPKTQDGAARLREASEEIMTSLWALMAGRWLNFGKMIFSPAHEILVQAGRRKRGTMRPESAVVAAILEKKEPPQERRRVLDLGGMPVADWGWHCALDYPAVKVYTVTQRTPATATSPTSPLSPSGPTAFSGPKNHRHITVDRLYRLPFPDNHFDVVSARTLFLILRTTSSTPASSDDDEYTRCLSECMRVLKPGGYFEYTLFDAAAINAGPIASNLFGKFSASLQASGRDPEPTAKWIPRLYQAGFTDIMRSWILMPLAPAVVKPKVPRKDGEDSRDIEEEVRRKMEGWETGGIQGSTKDVAAVAGLLTGWVWEKWVRSAGFEDAAAVVGQVVEEAKEMGSGLRTVFGYARKPM